jgi:hypothetical protein
MMFPTCDLLLLSVFMIYYSILFLSVSIWTMSFSNLVWHVDLFWFKVHWYHCPVDFDHWHKVQVLFYHDLLTVRNWFSVSGSLASWNWCAHAPNTTQNRFSTQCISITDLQKKFVLRIFKILKMDELCIFHLSCWQPETSKWVCTLDPKQRINYARPKIYKIVEVMIWLLPRCFDNNYQSDVLILLIWISVIEVSGYTSNYH